MSLVGVSVDASYCCHHTRVWRAKKPPDRPKSVSSQASVSRAPTARCAPQGHTLQARGSQINVVNCSKNTRHFSVDQTALMRLQLR
jgi:hypothetical protein